MYWTDRRDRSAAVTHHSQSYSKMRNWKITFFRINTWKWCRREIKICSGNPKLFISITWYHCSRFKSRDNISLSTTPWAGGRRGVTPAAPCYLLLARGRARPLWRQATSSSLTGPCSSSWSRWTRFSSSKGKIPEVRGLEAFWLSAYTLKRLCHPD
jgi:hypothetical protein